MSWFGVRSGIYRILPGLTKTSDSVTNRTIQRLMQSKKVVDIGAGGRRITNNTITIDRFTIQNTDIIADIHDLPVADCSLEGAFCTGTLEHVKNPEKVLSEIWRVLAHGGVAHIEVPFLQPFHADPHDYWRWTLPGLELICSRCGFDKIESGVHIGPASSLNWVANEFVLSLLGNGTIGTFASFLCRFIGFPILFLDRHIIHSKHSSRAASGIFFVGLKSGKSAVLQKSNTNSKKSR